jgi:autophagy-related protein 17
MLDALGAQVVPPDFHQPGVEDDVFGAPEDDVDPFAPSSHSRVNGASSGSSESDDALSSPATIRGELPALNGIGASKLDARRRRRMDRSRWKTLRDFVDERGIEDALEKMEIERTALEDLVLSTAGFPATIDAAVVAIRDGMPAIHHVGAQGLVKEVLEHQEKTSTGMAAHLESLAMHFDQIEGALRDSEAGEVFGEEDMMGETCSSSLKGGVC